MHLGPPLLTDRNKGFDYGECAYRAAYLRFMQPPPVALSAIRPHFKSYLTDYRSLLCLYLARGAAGIRRLGGARQGGDGERQAECRG